MLKIRVIPVLLWDGKQAVQSVNFKRPHRPVGSMMQHIENMENRNIDELIILDVEATIERREPFYTEIQEYTSKLFCPLTVGGGINKLDQIEKLLKSGADKVAINTALYSDNDFIYNAARKFGSQCIVASINSVYDHGVNVICNSDGTQTQGIQTRHVCKYAEELGCGEILLTDVWANGTLQGYNTDLIFECSYDIGIPVIGYGGAGTLQHMVAALRAGANAVASSSMFMFKDITPKDVSKHLIKEGFPARIDNKFMGFFQHG
jgi:cyclase